MVDHVESLLMVVQLLVSLVVHSHHNYTVHDEVVQVAADIEGLPSASVALVSPHNLFEELENMQRIVTFVFRLVLCQNYFWMSMKNQCAKLHHTRVDTVNNHRRR